MRRISRLTGGPRPTNAAGIRAGPPRACACTRAGWRSLGPWSRNGPFFPAREALHSSQHPEPIVASAPPTIENSDISPVSIVEEMKTSYLAYAMSVIVARALPDTPDGLQPVHPRIPTAAPAPAHAPGRPPRPPTPPPH